MSHMQISFLPIWSKKILSFGKNYLTEILKRQLCHSVIQSCVQHFLRVYWFASLVAQMVRNLPAMKETWVRFPGQEAPLEKGMVTHSSTLAWRIPWTEEPGGLQSMGSKRIGRD